MPGSDLIVNVGLSTQPILSPWRSRALIIGPVAVLLCGALVVFAVKLGKELRRRALAEAELAQLATTDGLTGLANRRRFDEVLEREWRRSVRTGTPLSLMVLDADHFKRVNDRYGHAIGDEMLKALAAAVNRCARRPGDLPARIGGEEFSVILPDTAEEGALFLAEKLRSELASSSIPLATGAIPACTVSIGVSTSHAEAESAIALCEAADRAVYIAKRAGRDRVEYVPISRQSIPLSFTPDLPGE